MNSGHRIAGTALLLAGMAPIAVAAQSGDTPESVQLAPLNVIGQAATKAETPFLETPQSVSEITREEMEEQGARTVQEAARYTPGVFAGQIGASKRYDYMVLRGFSDGSIDNVYLDGLKMLGDPGTFSTLQIDPYFLESAEVVKGPASVLYGRASPGGIVALTSKQPRFSSHREIQLGVGTQAQRQAAFDFTDRIGDSGRAAYRLTGLASRSDTQFDKLEQERYALAPSLTLNLSEATSLTLQAYLQDDPEGGSHSGLPAEGTLYPRNGRTISNNFFEGEPDYELFERTQRMLGYQLEHAFNDSWSVRQNFRYLNSDVRLQQVYAFGWASPTELNRYYSGADESLEAYAVDNQLQGEFATGALRHTLLMGVDYQRRRADVAWPSGSFPPIDAFDPEYGADPIAIGPAQRQDRELDQLGVYLQDQIALGNWRFTLGGRQDRVDIANRNPDTGTEDAGDWRQFSGRAGALYLFDNGLAPYASYSESFNPNSYADADGDLLEPTEGRQYELGMKFQPPGSASQVTASLFHIEQENVATREPQESFYRPVGEIRSRGFELESQLHVTGGLFLRGGYSYTEAKIHEAADGTEGNYSNMAPRHQASLWGTYFFDQGALDGLEAGLGVRHIADLWADDENTRKVPDYTLVDASMRYDLESIGIQGLSARLNVHNLFDKEYVASCYSLNYCYYGDERSVTATVSYDF
ncbi:TonB-dependent siderophore receptor [Aquisalimonas lutea]|uniref:TonB-dependent siderophore receptor n=1 Tax=Aquisalimonas lutea TaxID=1327750 RepID=UPI0025B41903|nr:TonB-dependent siderophore receptor [Aquisalimonas lutea]MDN3516841.1 TonB-dependent siderophore receptor [Aquisalimonas lutea]